MNFAAPISVNSQLLTVLYLDVICRIVLKSGEECRVYWYTFLVDLGWSKGSAASIFTRFILAQWRCLFRTQSIETCTFYSKCVWSKIIIEDFPVLLALHHHECSDENMYIQQVRLPCQNFIFTYFILIKRWVQNREYVVWLLQFCIVFTINLDVDASVSMLLLSSSFLS